ncbi:MAG: dTMP kinase [Clostridiales bacterium]|jgi:dTMP kinase|nr:dTMP kinase [Clostridiales bacterium]
MRRGLFITFEGLDFSGKTTQAARLADHLRSLGADVTAVREPGGTPVGERVREILADKSLVIGAKTESFLFAAARCQLMTDVMLPALSRGGIVVADRFLDSSLAYQGYAGGVDTDIVAELNFIATDWMEPDITFLLDVPVNVMFARRPGGYRADRIESRGVEFFEKARRGYIELTKRFKNRIAIVDGCAPEERVFSEVLRSIEPRLALYIKEEKK